MHPWDQPAEVLYEQGSKIRPRLVMPKLGEPVEPAHASGAVEPWWRSVDRVEGLQQQVGSESTEGKLPPTMPWPID